MKISVECEITHLSGPHQIPDNVVRALLAGLGALWFPVGINSEYEVTSAQVIERSVRAPVATKRA